MEKVSAAIKKGPLSPRALHFAQKASKSLQGNLKLEQKVGVYGSGLWLW